MNRIRNPIAIDATVISVDELMHRRSQALTQLQALAGVDPLARLESTIEALDAAVNASTTTVALHAHPGARGQVVNAVKRLIRRVLYWYVEPRWAAHRQVDRATLDTLKALRDLAVVMSTERDLLNREVEQLRVDLAGWSRLHTRKALANPI